MVVFVRPPVTLPALAARPKPRDLLRDDLPRVQSLLAVLPQLYPAGDTWLDHRLDDVLAGRARCTLVEVGDVVAGVAIETPKAFDRLKLSTFLIADEYRNAGVGGSLIRFLHDRWVRDAVGQVHVTVSEHHHEQVRRAFAPVGFLTVAHEVDRYGPGRNEYVMTCLPTQDGLR
jgi:GNAT superfamily N-acetyltransferase